MSERLIRDANKTVLTPSTAQNGAGQAGDAADPYQQRVERGGALALVDGYRSMREQGRDGHTGAGQPRRQAARCGADGFPWRAVAARGPEGGSGASAAAASPAGRRPTTAKAITVGSMLKDRFVLDKELGRGGMGAVYRAVDRRRLEAMHQFPYVAVKLLSGDFRVASGCVPRAGE